MNVVADRRNYYLKKYQDWPWRLFWRLLLYTELRPSRKFAMLSASFEIRAVAPVDVASWRALRRTLWPDTSLDDHSHETEQLLAEPHRHAIFIAVSSDGEPLGFAEAALRHDFVNGCDTSPVLFLEGIYVIPSMRRQGIARALCTSIARWGTAHGCVEFASDTSIDNQQAQALHRALGFDETERVVFFRKRILERSG